MNYKWKKNIAIFLACQMISIFGSSLVQYAITWHITLTTKSGIYTTLAIVFGFLPTFLLSPLAGVWADRYNRKMLIIISDGAIAAATLVLAVIFITGNGNIWFLLGALAIRAFGGAVQQPCINAMLPDVVPTEQLNRINGLYGTLNSVVGLVSPMVSGALMGFAPLQVIFFIDVITAVIAICAILFLFKLPEKEKTVEQSSSSRGYLKDIKSGLSYTMKTPWLRGLLFICIGIWICIGPISFLTPLQTARNYGDDVWRLTVIEVAFSVGMLLGGILISIWGGFHNRIRTSAFAGLFMAIGTTVLGFTMPFPPYVGVMTFIGFTMPFFNTPAITLLQERVDPQYIGRVFSLQTMISTSLMPLSMLLFGPLADAIPIEYLLLGTGLILIVLSLLIFTNKALNRAGSRLSNRQLIESGDIPPLEGTADSIPEIPLTSDTVR